MMEFKMNSFFISRKRGLLFYSIQPQLYGTVSIVMKDRSSEAFTLGQQFGDTFSLVQGLVEGVAGAMTALGGGGAAIITSPTVVGAVAGTTVAAGLSLRSQS